MERLQAAWAWLVGVVRQGMADPTRGEHHEALVDAQRSVVLHRVVVLIWISVYIMPTTILGYVAVVQPTALAMAAAVVGVAVALVLVLRLLVAQGVFDRHYHLAMFLLVGGVFGPTGALIIELTRSAEASFLFAFFMIYFAFTALFPANLGWVLGTCGALIASFVAVRMMRPEGLVVDTELVINVIYLAQLSFLSAVLNRVVVNLFFAERRSAMELEEAYAELRQLDQAKMSFFSNVSHELRTPLTLIITPIQQLMEHDELPAPLAERLRGIYGNASRLLKMVNQLLDFSKIEAGQAKVVPLRLDLVDFLGSIGELFRATAEERGIELVLDVPAQMPVVQDLDKLEQVMVNLMGNAMKFTSEGGTITIGAAADGADRFRMWVGDTGIGIPASAQAKVFERFSQVHGEDGARVRGTGIGLSMVREYAKLLGGDVGLASVEGEGSTFTLTLPREVGDATGTWSSDGGTSAAIDKKRLATSDLQPLATKEAERVITVAGADRPWLLIVDDNPALVSLVRSILEDDYNLYLAYSGREALRRLDEAEQVDLMISDVMMPGMTGLELCEAVKAQERHQLLPVILLTARGGQARKVEGLDAGADDYIGKPFDPEELRARVRQLFEHRAITRQIESKSVELADALERLKQEEVMLVASERMRTMGELAAGVFHELHNYLNMIKNGAVPLKDLVEMQQEDDGEPLTSEDLDEMIDLADLVLTAANQALGVTGELKGYAYQDANVLRVADLHDVIRSNVRLFGKIPPELTIDLQLADEQLPVRCSPTRLVQVFTNLVKNAFEAMDHEGTVTIRTRIDGDVVEARVSDTGPGVPEAFQPKLFEPFQSTKGQGQGLGLGLSLTQSVVEDLGGTITYDPEGAQGACFVVRLPRAAK